MTQNSDRIQGPQVISVPGVGDLNLSSKDDIDYYILQRQGESGVVPGYVSVLH